MRGTALDHWPTLVMIRAIALGDALPTLGRKLDGIRMLRWPRRHPMSRAIALGDALPTLGRKLDAIRMLRWPLTALARKLDVARMLRWPLTATMKESLRAPPRFEADTPQHQQNRQRSVHNHLCQLQIVLLPPAAAVAHYAAGAGRSTYAYTLCHSSLRRHPRQRSR